MFFLGGFGWGGGVTIVYIISIFFGMMLCFEYGGVEVIYQNR